VHGLQAEKIGGTPVRNGSAQLSQALGATSQTSLAMVTSGQLRRGTVRRRNDQQSPAQRRPQPGRLMGGTIRFGGNISQADLEVEAQRRRLQNRQAGVSPTETGPERVIVIVTSSCNDCCTAADAADPVGAAAGGGARAAALTAGSTAPVALAGEARTASAGRCSLGARLCTGAARP
jgi:hypothetical protein